MPQINNLPPDLLELCEGLSSCRAYFQTLPKEEQERIIELTTDLVARVWELLEQEQTPPAAAVGGLYGLLVGVIEAQRLEERLENSGTGEYDACGPYKSPYRNRPKPTAFYKVRKVKAAAAK